MSEAKKSTLEGKEDNVLSEYGYSTGCPNLMRNSKVLTDKNFHYRLSH